MRGPPQGASAISSRSRFPPDMLVRNACWSPSPREASKLPRRSCRFTARRETVTYRPFWTSSLIRRRTLNVFGVLSVGADSIISLGAWSLPLHTTYVFAYAGIYHLYVALQLTFGFPGLWISAGATSLKPTKPVCAGPAGGTRSWVHWGSSRRESNILWHQSPTLTVCGIWWTTESVVFANR